LTPKKSIGTSSTNRKRRVRIVEKEKGVTQSGTKVLWCEDEICEGPRS